jgi:type IV pilus assembly protein PilM
MKSMVGLDIGASSVRVAEVLGLDSQGYALVRRYASLPLRREAITSKGISQPELVAAAIQAVVRQARVTSAGLIVGINTTASGIVYEAAPFGLSTSERESMIRLSANEISPTVPLSDGAISTQVTGTDTRPDGAIMSQLLVGIAQRQHVDQIQKILKLARVKVQAIDFTGAATLRAYLRPPVGSTNVLAVIDIGSVFTNVAVAQGPYLRSLKTLPIGSASLTRAFLSVLGDSSDKVDINDQYDKAEEIKANYEVKIEGFSPNSENFYRPSYTDSSLSNSQESNTSHSQLDEAVDRALEELIVAIQGAIDADAASFAGGGSGTPIEGILLAGRGSLLRGFKDRLAQRLSVPVQLGRPIARVSGYAEEDMEQTLISLGSAIGLGLWEEPV